MSSTLLTNLHPCGSRAFVPLRNTQAGSIHKSAIRMDRLSMRAKNKTKQQEEPVVTTTSAPAQPEEPKDFWEGEQFEIVGKAASFALPVLVAVALGVGFFAAQTYNQDATVFLTSPKGPEDTAKLVVLE